MLFNSFEFVFFLPIVFTLYWLISSRRIKGQNFLILVSSYVFYGWWDARFLSLIIFSTLLDFTLGYFLGKEQDQKRRRSILILSIVLNLGVLGFFKYYNFFVDSFIESFALFGTHLNPSTLDIILPVGISFYTFQTLSYTIDVYRKKIDPTSDLIAFAAFVSFFPQLVAGPIERASHLLPQFLNKRKFEYTKAVDGLRQILWGLFKKVVIADNCAELVKLAFDHPESFTGISLVLGLVYFSIQIYCDFSGYSDIAIGSARLFGFDLKKNFAFPFFSRNIGEFWRRWHISLSTWFRDYLYIPLGGSRGSLFLVIRNTIIIFLVSGFWHGANWTFIIWGGLHAVYFIPLIILKPDDKQREIVAYDRFFPRLKEIIQILFTFGLVTIAWVFFRAENLESALTYYYHIFDLNFFGSISATMLNSLYLLPLLFIVEWFGRKNEYATEKLALKFPTLIRWTIYFIMIVCICLNAGNEQEFIYFQF